MKPTPRDLMVARAVVGRNVANETDLAALIESLPEPAEPVGDESGTCKQHDVYACRKCWTARPAEHGQAVQDTDDEDWLDKLVRENGGEVEFFTRAQVDAARAEGYERGYAEGARAEREAWTRRVESGLEDYYGQSHLTEYDRLAVVLKILHALVEDEHGGGKS